MIKELITSLSPSFFLFIFLDAYFIWLSGPQCSGFFLFKIEQSLCRQTNVFLNEKYKYLAFLPYSPELVLWGGWAAFVLILAVLLCSVTGHFCCDLWWFRISNIIPNFIFCRIAVTKGCSFLCASLFNQGYNFCSMCLVWEDNLIETYFLPFTNQTPWKTMKNNESNNRELREVPYLSNHFLFAGSWVIWGSSCVFLSLSEAAQQNVTLNISQSDIKWA